MKNLFLTKYNGIYDHLASTYVLKPTMCLYSQ